MTRVAIISDVHGSLVALKAVISDMSRLSPDVVLHGGDLVMNGPRPNEVVNTIRERGWQGVLGNTDEMLWSLDGLSEQVKRMPEREALYRTMYEHIAPAALVLLSEVNLNWLRQLPQQLEFEDITLLHARPGDLWKAPPPDAPDSDMSSTYAGLPTPVVVYGHIHRPFVRTVGDQIVANSGSVGLPWDGDPRASYLLVENDRAEVVRVVYDIEKEVSDLYRQAIPYSGWLSEMRRLGRFVRPDSCEP